MRLGILHISEHILYGHVMLFTLIFMHFVYIEKHANAYRTHKRTHMTLKWMDASITIMLNI